MKAFKDDSNTTRIAVLETVASQTNQTLLRLEKKIDESFLDLKNEIIHLVGKIDKKMDKVEEKLEKKIDRLDNKIDEVRKENTSHFRMTIFTLMTLIGTPLLLESIKILSKFVTG